MRAVVPLPDHPYYLWQAHVQATQFEERGLPVTYLLYGDDRRASDLARRVFADRSAHYWQDTREPSKRDYNAAMKPWLLARYLEEKKPGSPLLYLDPDVLLAGRDLRTLDLQPWTASDTDSYTGPTYLDSKGVLLDLCEIVGLPETFDPRSWRGAGAQYVLGDSPSALWYEIADLSVRAYDYMVREGDRLKSLSDPYPVQAWCAEMYVTQLVLIREGYGLAPSDSLNFLWADSPSQDWGKATFFHNAGVIAENGRDFCKLTWQNSPFGHSHSPHPDSASSLYVRAIRTAEERHPEIIGGWV